LFPPSDTRSSQFDPGTNLGGEDRSPSTMLLGGVLNRLGGSNQSVVNGPLGHQPLVDEAAMWLFDNTSVVLQKWIVFVYRRESI